ncbi:MAG: ion transporter [Burkholderiaceae bacterium]|jgi:voltage-gated sodium channel
MSENKKQAAWQLKIENFVAHHWIQTGIVVLIIINALLLGMETSESIMDVYGPELHLLDHAILGIFICEIALLMLARGLNFFKDPWCVFDFVVIAIALIPASEALAVLRSLRVLRVLRLINKVQSMRKVVKGLLGSLASLGSVIGLMLIVFYVSAVISTNLFAKEFPDWFGNLGASFFTLFQIMTLESWSEGIARPVMEKFPYSWVFFLSFIMIATFTVINLFIAAIVDSFSSASHEEREENTRHLKESKLQEDEKRQQQIINEELDSIRLELQEIKSLIQKIR